MQNINTSRYLECLIGLQCRISCGSSEYLIIDISPEHSLVLLSDDGSLTYVDPTKIRFTEKGHSQLIEKVWHQNRRMMK